MSEDEIIDKINYMINNWHRNVVEINIQWIRGLLDLYNKEKEKNKEIDLHYVPYEQYVTKLNEANEKWKDKIRDMQRYRKFELQQEYKDFENDVELKTYNKILEEE